MRDLKSIFLDVADATANNKSHTEALGLAQQVLGRGATDLMVLLKEESTGIRALTDEAKELGGVYSSDLAKASEAYADALTNQQQALTGVRNEIGEAFLPLMQAAVEATTGFLADNREEIGELADKIADDLGPALERFVELAGSEDVQKFVETLGDLTSLSFDVVTRGLSDWAKLLDDIVSDKKLSAWFRFASLFGGPIGQGINIARGAMGGLGEETEEAADAVKTLDERLAQIGLPDIKGAVEIEGLPPVPGPLDVAVDMAVDEMGLPELREQAEDVTATMTALGEVSAEQFMTMQEHVERLTAALQDDLINSIGQASNQMIKSMSFVAAKGIDDMANMKDAATAVWKSFKQTVIAALVEMIAKMTIAAILAAFLGMGNAGAGPKVARLFGVAREFNALTGNTEPGGQFGGSVASILRRRRGSGIGDSALLPVEPGEGIITKPAMSRLGGAGLAGINAGAMPLGGPGDAAFSGGRTIVIENNVRTIFGTREEGREVARGVAEAMEELGFVVGVG
ncbi:MAG: phage tail tape measure protein [Planctomycetota bacterium]